MESAAWDPLKGDKTARFERRAIIEGVVNDKFHDF
jgi:hypothetical protein